MVEMGVASEYFDLALMDKKTLGWFDRMILGTMDAYPMMTMDEVVESVFRDLYRLHFGENVVIF